MPLPLSRSLPFALALLPCLLTSCTPTALRPQKNAQVQIQAALTEPPFRAISGEQVYVPPQPQTLSVQTSRPAYVTAIVLPEQRYGLDWLPGGAVVLQQAETGTGGPALLPLPATLGFTQVYTVASLSPLDLSSLSGRRSVGEVARAVEAVTRTLPPGSFNVDSLNYRVSRLGGLRVTVSEPGASVAVGGQVVGYSRWGETLTVPNLPEGSVTLTVERPGFVTWSYPVTVEAGRLKPVEVRLTRPQVLGRLQVTSAVEAGVYANGDPVGKVGPGNPLSLTRRAGPLTLKVVPVAGGQGVSLDMVLMAGQSRLVACTRTPDFACQLK